MTGSWSSLSRHTHGLCSGVGVDALTIEHKPQTLCCQIMCSCIGIHQTPRRSAPSSASPAAATARRRSYGPQAHARTHAAHKTARSGKYADSVCRGVLSQCEVGIPGAPSVPAAGEAGGVGGAGAAGAYGALCADLITINMPLERAEQASWDAAKPNAPESCEPQWPESAGRFVGDAQAIREADGVANKVCVWGGLHDYPGRGRTSGMPHAALPAGGRLEPLRRCSAHDAPALVPAGVAHCEPAADQCVSVPIGQVPSTMVPSTRTCQSLQLAGHGAPVLYHPIAELRAALEHGTLRAAAAPVATRLCC